MDVILDGARTPFGKFGGGQGIAIVIENANGI